MPALLRHRGLTWLPFGTLQPGCSVKLPFAPTTPVSKQLPLVTSIKCTMLGSAAYTAATWHIDHTASTCRIRGSWDARIVLRTIHTLLGCLTHPNSQNKAHTWALMADCFCVLKCAPAGVQHLCQLSHSGRTECTACGQALMHHSSLAGDAAAGLFKVMQAERLACKTWHSESVEARRQPKAFTACSSCMNQYQRREDCSN